MKMKKEYIYVILLVVFVIGVESFKFVRNKYFPPKPVEVVEKIAPDYTIEDFDMLITVMENGDLLITENILYNLKNTSDQVFRNYTLKEYPGVKSYQPEKLGIAKVVCNSEELVGDIVTATGIKINPKQESGVKAYTIEYILENSVEKCNNVSEFLCNLNISTLEKELENIDIVVKANNSGDMLDAQILGSEDFKFILEDGKINAHLDKYVSGDLWLNVKLQNECVPKSENYMLEDRSLMFERSGE